MDKTTISIPKGLLKRVKLVASNRDKTIKQAATEALEKWMGDSDRASADIARTFQSPPRAKA